MALSTPIPPLCSSSKSLLSLKSLKPLNPLLVFSHSSRPRTHFSHTKSRRLRVEATAILDSANGPVGVAPAKEDENATASPYGRQFFPLAAVVGQDAIKTALLLGAVDREIGGIAISGKRGTAKTVMARGLHAILPPIEVVVGSVANADPACPEEWEDGLSNKVEYDSAGNIKTQIVRSPFVQIPLGVTEDRLVGSVDVEESVKSGTTVFQPGLLAEAHRGVLYVDEINLLDEGISNLLLNVLTEGVNIVEREGISFRHPCKPLLIATYNPEEGAVREHLLDRIAINLSADLPMSFEDRVAAVEIATQFQEQSNEVLKMVEEEMDDAKTQIILAREYLKDVSISREQLKYLVMEALRGGCQGHRAELYAARVARCLAALEGREKVNVDDLKKARAHQNNKNQQPPPPPPQNQDSGEEQNEEEDQEDENDEENEQQQDQIPEEFIFDAEGGLVDEKLLSLRSRHRESGGKLGELRMLSFLRIEGDILSQCFLRSDPFSFYFSLKGPVKRLAVDATLRAAAPYQKLRREKDIQKSRKVFVEKTDMRAKRMARKAGALVIFVVDASGSMALNRMQNAKGAALKLLAESYTSRDQVCIIPFRGDAAEVLLPPSRSISMARKRLERLPCGGGSPLAHGLTTAVRVGMNAEKSGDVGRIMIVVLTDGRANISLKRSTDLEAAADMPRPSAQELKDEILEVAGKIYKAGMSLLVIDTENKFVSTGFAKEIARVAQGKYYYLPNASDAVISATTRDALSALKNS
ncbi:UNVERIFIED_CONTAM: Magnesium-chelatase subunit ChlD, chloroplastic [Sesamum angustifolium]|uniref:Mg-protoporphyrin IX chelatase n=1 Tax=Sesamum angustifolium TaxID=2727405 RepID=A0AAW2QT17_9LAMI